MTQDYIDYGTGDGEDFGHRAHLSPREIAALAAIEEDLEDDGDEIALAELIDDEDPLLAAAEIVRWSR